MKRLFFSIAAIIAVGSAMAQTDADSLSLGLAEVMVKGEKPQAKLKGNALVYDAEVMRERFTPTTAFDMLQHVPEIKVDGDDISLVGAKSVLLVLDGRANMTDIAQVVERLKALPSEQVASIDITHVAPAKYNFVGALINVRTVAGCDKLTALAEEQVSQARKTSSLSKASVMYDHKQLSLFGAASYMYNDGWRSSFYKMYDGYRCDTEMRTFSNVLRINAEASYLFGKNTKLTADYYGNIADEVRKDWRMAIDPTSNQQQTFIRSRRLTDEALHSAGIELELPRKWAMAARYKNYGSPYTQCYGTSKSDYDHADLAVAQTSTQDIDNWQMSLNKDYALANNATMSAGVIHNFTSTGTSVDYGSATSLGQQREWNTALYAQADFTLWKKMSVTLGLRGERSKQLYKDKATGVETTVWNDLWLFPTLQMSLPLNDKGHALQLSLQSDKEFPGYWWISPQTTVIDERSLSVGNPNMRPSRSYYTTFDYRTGRNWTFWIGCSYVKDGLARLPHYDATLDKTIYTGENYDLSLHNSIGVQYTKTVGNFTTSAVAQGSYSKYRIDDYHGADYENTDFEGYVSWRNDLKLPLGKRGSTMMLHADASYMTPIKNGFTEWSNSWSMNAHAQWIASPKLRIQLGCNNILRRANMRWTKINITGHEIHESHYNTRTAYMRLTFMLGKQRQMKQGRNESDSRFGR